MSLSEFIKPFLLMVAFDTKQKDKGHIGKKGFKKGAEYL